MDQNLDHCKHMCCRRLFLRLGAIGRPDRRNHRCSASADRQRPCRQQDVAGMNHQVFAPLAEESHLGLVVVMDAVMDKVHGILGFAVTSKCWAGE